ncbi:rhomboid family intramembrane serine protease [Lysinibacter sp. HNR]|uniref:rhomboid family intramembrane serine protease n=1 Tax=Lysinibacter sp. HNR TaxID=3031408 RepID=UPI0024358CE6|nr:rhomboid family intramembrane serine protease [Lysinibacter sp. HNR]WGD37355.1 rhomboid family intramembrane serine protease [Lysinibacter sp. HNR]
MSANYGQQASEKSSNTCYRHPDRQSFVLCQRCGRTICPECQTQAPVGVLCPSCVREGQIPSRSVGRRVSSYMTSDKPVVTYTIIAICAVVYAIQWIGRPFGVTEALFYAPLHSFPEIFEPWRMITSMFSHSPTFFLHIVLNMFSLWIFGRILESFLGKARFIALFLVSGFAGSVMVMLSGYISQQYALTPVVGASGAIFGLMGAFLVIQKKLGSNVRQLLVLLVINFGITFLPGVNISWQAHVGGFVGGLVIGAIYLYTRKPSQKWLQVGLVSLWAVVLILLSLSFWVLPVNTFW